MMNNQNTCETCPRNKISNSNNELENHLVNQILGHPTETSANTQPEVDNLPSKNRMAAVGCAAIIVAGKCPEFEYVTESQRDDGDMFELELVVQVVG